MPGHQRVMCPVCRACGGSLTTDCPGVAVDYDRQREVYETNLDYTDARGWHRGDPAKLRSPHFAPEPGPVPVPTLTCLQHDLTRKAVAWARADREADDHAAVLIRVEDKAKKEAEELARAKVDFHLSNQRADECDDELRQAAREIADALDQVEGSPEG